MENLVTKRLKFLEETLEYYKTHTRAIKSRNKENGSTICTYIPTEGNEGCAIGRHLSDVLKSHLNEANNPVSYNSVFDVLPDSLKELGQPFLIHVQTLHDTNDYWENTPDANLLNTKGNSYYSHIKKQYC